MGGTVELAFAVIFAADEGDNFAVGAHDDDCALGDVLFGLCAADFGGEGVFGECLDARDEGGFDDDVFGGGADEVVDLVDDPVGIVALGVAVRFAAGFRDFFADGDLFVGGQIAGIDHGVDDDVGALSGFCGVGAGGEAGRGFEQAGEGGGFA